MPNFLKPSVLMRLLLIACCLAGQNASAEISSVLDYQGYLTTTAGAPVTGSQTVTVALYTAASGGVAAWSQTSALSVTDGRFSMLLDGRSTSGNPFSPTLFDQPLFAGIRISTDPEMSPRTLLSAVPYSFKAADANTLNGLSAVEITAAAQPAPAVYMGASATNPSGGAGLIVMNNACNSTYPGSRMCTSPEIMAHEGPLNITKPQHVQPVIVSTIGTTSSSVVVVDYSGAKAPYALMFCGSVTGNAQLPWASTGAGVTGMGLTTGSTRLGFIDCGDQDAAAVACCKVP